MTAGTVLLLVFLFQVKHLLADYVFQSGWMVTTKGRYGHPGGFVHAGLHGLLTIPVLLAAPVTLVVVLIIAAAEAVLHYHIDWAKSAISHRMDLRPENKGYWVAMGADQFAHQLTYVAILALVLGLAA